jgi:hypothetical protein
MNPNPRASRPISNELEQEKQPAGWNFGPSRTRQNWRPRPSRPWKTTSRHFAPTSRILIAGSTPRRRPPRRSRPAHHRRRTIAWSDLSERQESVRLSLMSRRSVLAEVLAALQRIGRDPPPALLVSPEDALSSVSSAILLGAVVPEIRAETEALAADLKELATLRQAIAAERVRLPRRSNRKRRRGTAARRTCLGEGRSAGREPAPAGPRAPARRGPLGALKRARIGDRLAGQGDRGAQRGRRSCTQGRGGAAAAGSPNGLSAPVLSPPSPCPTKTALPAYAVFETSWNARQTGGRRDRCATLVPMTAPAIRLRARLSPPARARGARSRPMPGSPMPAPSGAMDRW